MRIYDLRFTIYAIMALATTAAQAQITSGPNGGGSISTPVSQSNGGTGAALGNNLAAGLTYTGATGSPLPDFVSVPVTLTHGTVYFMAIAPLANDVGLFDSGEGQVVGSVVAEGTATNFTFTGTSGTYYLGSEGNVGDPVMTELVPVAENALSVPPLIGFGGDVSVHALVAQAIYVSQLFGVTGLPSLSGNNTWAGTQTWTNGGTFANQPVTFLNTNFIWHVGLSITNVAGSHLWTGAAGTFTAANGFPADGNGTLPPIYVLTSNGGFTQYKCMQALSSSQLITFDVPQAGITNFNFATFGASTIYKDNNGNIQGGRAQDAGVWLNGLQQNSTGNSGGIMLGVGTNSCYIHTLNDTVTNWLAFTMYNNPGGYAFLINLNDTANAVSILSTGTLSLPTGAVTKATTTAGVAATQNFTNTQTFDIVFSFNITSGLWTNFLSGGTAIYTNATSTTTATTVNLAPGDYIHASANMAGAWRSWP